MGPPEGFLGSGFEQSFENWFVVVNTYGRSNRALVLLTGLQELGMGSQKCLENGVWECAFGSSIALAILGLGSPVRRIDY